MRWLALGLLVFAGCHVKVVAYGEIDPEAVGSIVREVSRVRRLRVLRPIRVALQPARELRATVERDMRAEVESGELARRQRALAKLGLIDWDDDVEAFYRRAYSSEPAGYYVTEERRLYVVARDTFRSDVGEVVGAVTGRDPTTGETLAHEVAHALVHQHVDLEALVGDAPDGDARMARRCLGEGDATRVGFLYAGGSSFTAYLRRMQRIVGARDEEEREPRWLQDELRFPYLEGGRFVEHLFRRGGWTAVDAAYRRSPASTEQILHPERYPADRPVAIEVPEAVRPADGARRIFDDVLGERGARELVRRFLGEDRALRVGAGWDGDRAVVWEHEGRLSLVWVTAWDRPEDARELADGYRAIVERAYRTRSIRRERSDEIEWSTPEGPVGIARAGSRVAVYEGFRPGGNGASIFATVGTEGEATGLRESNEVP